MLYSVGVVAQQTPSPKQTKEIAIMGATAHIGNGNVIENSLIIFKNGVLTTVADATVVRADLTGIEVINASGKHVYPGFIVSNSTLGLVEIDAVRATDDESELGAWNPNVSSLIAYNAESKVVESMRPNGVLLGQITPRGGTFSGSSSVVQFDAWNWEDAAVKVDEGIHLNWPNNFSGSKLNDKYGNQVTKIQNFVDQSKAYEKGDEKIKNLPYQALEGLFDGSKTLYIHVNDEKGIADAVNFSKDNGIKHMVIVGGYDAYKVASLLKENNIAVMLQRVHSLPELDDEDYDLPYKEATLLVNKGVMVALETSGDMERMNSRNLPFYAGTTVANGLTKEQALELITLNPAKILGIDDQYGSLVEGKSATLFISEGDALDMRSNQLSRAFIDGRDISLATHQTKLWHRYENKYKEENIYKEDK